MRAKVPVYWQKKGGCSPTRFLAGRSYCSGSILVLEMAVAGPHSEEPPHKRRRLECENLQLLDEQSMKEELHVLQKTFTPVMLKPCTGHLDYALFKMKACFGISLMRRLYLQECSVCGLDPRRLGCGHTACPRCVHVNAKKTMIGCPHCNEIQSMPENGIAGLPIDVMYLKATASDEAKGAADFSHCIICASPASLTCCCTNTHFCSGHAELHQTVCNKGVYPFAATQAVTGPMCPTDPGASLRLCDWGISLGAICAAAYTSVGHCAL